MYRVETNAKEDEEFVEMEQNGDEMEEDSNNSDEMLGPIYCSICKEVFLDPRSLAKHIIKEHCSKGTM